VTAGMIPVTGGVTLLPLASFRTQASAPIVEPPPLTRGLVTATHIVPSVPASLVVPPKSDLGTPGLCLTNVNTGTTAFETVCSVPTNEVSATTKQPQVTIRSQAESSSAQSISALGTQTKSAEGPTPPSSGPSTTPVATSRPASAPVVSAPIVVVKQPQPTKPYTGQTSWNSIEYFTRLALCSGWTNNVEKAQYLLVALEGAAAETVRGLTAKKDADYDAIWENLSRRFGHIDEPEDAKCKFDSKDNLNLRLSLCSNKGCDQFSERLGQLLTLRQKNLILCYNVVW